MIRIHLKQLAPSKEILKNIVNIAASGSLQFLIGSASWIFMARLMTGYGSHTVAGYTIAIRWFIFFLMPAWGLSNAASTLVGQNLGANQPERAEQSVWKTAKYNVVFMILVMFFFLAASPFLVKLINIEPDVVEVATVSLRMFSLGCIFWGIGMVMMNAFNGAGDSKTPTYINLFWYWLIQVPLAWCFTNYLHWGPNGIFFAIVFTEISASITSIILFKKGKWKKIRI